MLWPLRRGLVTSILIILNSRSKDGAANSRVSGVAVTGAASVFV